MNVLDLPGEIWALILKKASYVSKIMITRTCHYALTLEDCLSGQILKNTKNKEFRLDSLKKVALREGSRPVLEYLFQLGMTINRDEYESWVDINDLDLILELRYRVVDGWNSSPNSQLAGRIMKSSMSVECVNYAIFCVLDQGKSRGKKRTLEITFMHLYDHPDPEMLEKVNLLSRKRMLEKISEYAPSRIGIFGGRRLIRDLGYPPGESLWGAIANGAFWECCRGRDKYEILDDLFQSDRLRIASEVAFFSRMISDAVTSSNPKALEYCLQKKIPVPVSERDHHFQRNLKGQSIPFWITEDKPVSVSYLLIKGPHLNSSKFLTLTKRLISLGMSINPRNFRYGHFKLLLKIEAIELLMKHGALPDPSLLEQARLSAPSIVPRLLELGFVDH